MERKIKEEWDRWDSSPSLNCFLLQPKEEGVGVDVEPEDPPDNSKKGFSVTNVQVRKDLKKGVPDSPSNVTEDVTLTEKTSMPVEDTAASGRIPASVSRQSCLSSSSITTEPFVSWADSIPAIIPVVWGIPAVPVALTNHGSMSEPPGKSTSRFRSLQPSTVTDSVSLQQGRSRDADVSVIRKHCECGHEPASGSSSTVDLVKGSSRADEQLQPFHNSDESGARLDSVQEKETDTVCSNGVSTRMDSIAESGASISSENEIGFKNTSSEHRSLDGEPRRVFEIIQMVYDTLGESICPPDPKFELADPESGSLRTHVKFPTSPFANFAWAQLETELVESRDLENCGGFFKCTPNKTLERTFRCHSNPCGLKIPSLDRDAVQVDIKWPERKKAAMDTVEEGARYLFHVNSVAELLLAAAFRKLSQLPDDTSEIRSLLTMLNLSITQNITVSSQIVGNTILSRRDELLRSSEMLKGKVELQKVLRQAPLSSASVFGGRVDEVAKIIQENLEAAKNQMTVEGVNSGRGTSSTLKRKLPPSEKRRKHKVKWTLS